MEMSSKIWPLTETKSAKILFGKQWKANNCTSVNAVTWFSANLITIFQFVNGDDINQTGKRKLVLDIVQKMSSQLTVRARVELPKSCMTKVQHLQFDTKTTKMTLKVYLENRKVLTSFKRISEHLKNHHKRTVKNQLYLKIYKKKTPR